MRDLKILLNRRSSNISTDKTMTTTKPSPEDRVEYSTDSWKEPKQETPNSKETFSTYINKMPKRHPSLNSP